VDRFNEDLDCRVSVGSLKAGGVGIDLVAASVVIHYDRWWNAAKEDQATDRVHRIGQTRGVQVFKLITEGTLEEKIAAIIAKKRDLMDSIVKEDDPSLLKTFSKSELIEMLSMPAESTSSICR
jgi:SNF2 family DNA or RNA helicase